ncbi:MAG: amidohydrolase family protein, partial [Candidatus Rokubacteria bacterium]|nr:amidohydrolase family protein [Candidatus Rokubacteria bacterium]
MEFNIFEHFKGIEKIPKDPTNADQQGTSFFLTGHMGEQVSAHLDDYAAKARMSRRSFVKSACGFAAAMLAVNKTTGMKFFDVQEAEAYDPKAQRELSVARKAGMDLVIDQHTHICWRKDGYVKGVNTSERGMWFVDLLDNLGKAMGLPNGTRDMTVDNFGKLILEGSDTSVAIFNPFGFREDYGGKDMIPIEEQAEVRERWPARTIMMAGGLTPNQGVQVTLERLQMYVEKHKISGLKLYTFDSTPKKGWWFDDQRLAYPIWERCRKLGIKNIGCHKGIPFGQFMARYAHVEDFDKVEDDFTDLNWIVFHSAWPYHNELAALKGFKPQ